MGDTLISRTKQMLRAAGLQARKGLGQNFLVDGGVNRKILVAADLQPGDTVIEVGPGLGVLTEELAKLAGKVIAVELDRQLAGILQEKYTGAKNVRIIQNDILLTVPSALLPDKKTKYKVVANLPYYITSAVIRHFLESDIKPELMVLMVQKEVAKQITALPGAMSLLSVSVQLYGQPCLVDTVPARSFYPAPNVESAILRIDVFPEATVGLRDKENFFKVVKAGFSANRQQIINPLSRRLELTKTEVLNWLEKAGIDSHRRAETLTVTEWKRLAGLYPGRKQDDTD